MGRINRLEKTRGRTINLPESLMAWLEDRAEANLSSVNHVVAVIVRDAKEKEKKK